jgi:small multidrug resistance pump
MRLAIAANFVSILRIPSGASAPVARLRAARPPRRPSTGFPPMLANLTVSQAWAVLGVAILFEVAGTTCMRLSEGFTRLTPSLLIFAFYLVSFALNTMIIRVLGLSVVYAVWSGVGTVLTSLIGYLYFKEPASAMKVMSTMLIVAGVLGLHSASRGA